MSGTVYGVSTAGSIVGTLGTTFFLIPLIGTRAITLFARRGRPRSAALVLMALPRLERAPRRDAADGGGSSRLALARRPRAPTS